MKSVDDDDEPIGRLVAEYSEEINRLRAVLLWVSEHSSDHEVVKLALYELNRRRA